MNPLGPFFFFFMLFPAFYNHILYNISVKKKDKNRQQEKQE